MPFSNPSNIPSGLGSPQYFRRTVRQSTETRTVYRSMFLHNGTLQISKPVVTSCHYTGLKQYGFVTFLNSLCCLLGTFSRHFLQRLDQILHWVLSLMQYIYHQIPHGPVISSHGLLPNLLQDHSFFTQTFSKLKELICTQKIMYTTINYTIESPYTYLLITV